MQGCDAVGKMTDAPWYLRVFIYQSRWHRGRSQNFHFQEPFEPDDDYHLEMDIFYYKKEFLDDRSIDVILCLEFLKWKDVSKRRLRTHI